jgi:hypothetical protein
MKGARVVINRSFQMPADWTNTGTVIAESEECLGVKLDDGSITVLVRKAYVRVLTEFN